MAVDVFYSGGLYQATNETPNMSGMDLFRNLAGAVALWIGASLLTLLELVELLMFLFISKGMCPKKGGVDPYAASGSDGDLCPPAVHTAAPFGYAQKMWEFL